MKEYVYNDSFRMFCEFYNDIQNINLGELEFKEFDFPNFIIENKSDIENELKDNAKVLINLLFEAHYILKDISAGMKLVFINSELDGFENMILKLDDDDKNNNDFKDNFYNFKSLSLQQQEIFVKIFYLAKIVQKICLNDNLSNEIVEGFSNTLLNIEEDLEFKKFRKFFKKICILRHNLSNTIVKLPYKFKTRGLRCYQYCH
ncbi:hypothetical protein N5U55_11195 [Aliarcobacter butzleri]|uniref:hypothetical protein n=1 Tax=Aliarcobacter butzleri TaxID=28197 RepID=UPI0021B2F422|nr:hypothetical protein [Aliarcobacter butzleri]MCT7584666.1 hypothetical protein [Aliarcobacter butzleri]